MEDLPLLLLHHVGARSGVERVTPLVYWPVTDQSVAVLASNYGAPRHPGWFYNLLANPTATVELGPQTWKVHARVARADERANLIHDMAASPAVAAAIGRTSREIPVVVLDLLLVIS